MNDKKNISKDAVPGARFVWKTPVITVLGSEATEVGKKRGRNEKIKKKGAQGPS